MTQFEHADEGPQKTSQTTGEIGEPSSDTIRQKERHMTRKDLIKDFERLQPEPSDEMAKTFIEYVNKITSPDELSYLKENTSRLKEPQEYMDAAALHSDIMDILKNIPTSPQKAKVYQKIYDAIKGGYAFVDYDTIDSKNERVQAVGLDKIPTLLFEHENGKKILFIYPDGRHGMLNGISLDQEEKPGMDTQGEISATSNQKEPLTEDKERIMEAYDDGTVTDEEYDSLTDEEREQHRQDLMQEREDRIRTMPYDELMEGILEQGHVLEKNGVVERMGKEWVSKGIFPDYETYEAFFDGNLNPQETRGYMMALLPYMP